MTQTPLIPKLHSGKNFLSKKKFDFSFLSGVTAPILIVIAGLIVIYGINALLTTERTYRDLVKELQTKTFGNRWVAAFELSKYLSTTSIPADEIPWLVTNLSSAYNESVDNKTRDFIIIALGTLKTKEVLPVFAKALKDPDPLVQFHALVALGNYPPPLVDFNWDDVQNFLQASDSGLRQVALLTLANHQRPGGEKLIIPLLRDTHVEVRYAAATALIYYKHEMALPLLREILLLDSAKLTQNNPISSNQYVNLKLNVINALGKLKWKSLISELEEVATKEKNLEVVMRAREVLKILKD